MRFRPIEIAHPRSSAWLLPFAMPFLVALFALLIWISWSGLVEPGGSVLRRAQALVLFGIGIFILYMLLQYIRGWYAYWTHYELSDSGIQVTHPNGTVDFVAWEEITLAIGTGWPPAIRLYCARTRRPLTLFDPSPSTTDGFQFKRAQVVVRSKLGPRWKWRFA